MFRELRWCTDYHTWCHEAWAWSGLSSSRAVVLNLWLVSSVHNWGVRGSNPWPGRNKLCSSPFELQSLFTLHKKGVGCKSKCCDLTTKQDHKISIPALVFCVCVVLQEWTALLWMWVWMCEDPCYKRPQMLDAVSRKVMHKWRWKKRKEKKKSENKTQGNAAIIKVPFSLQCIGSQTIVFPKFITVQI